jgi:hypothetical protein
VSAPSAGAIPSLPCGDNSLQSPPFHYHADGGAESSKSRAFSLRIAGRLLGPASGRCRIERYITASVDNNGAMTAAQARQLATALVDAADELERLRSSGTEPHS